MSGLFSWLSFLPWVSTPVVEHPTQHPRGPGDDTADNPRVDWSSGAIVTINFNDPPKEFKRSLGDAEKVLSNPSPWNSYYRRNKK